MTDPVDNIYSLPPDVQMLAMMREAARSDALKGGGGGGTSGGMEARIAVLETNMETVRKDVAELRKDMIDVKVQLATLAERVAHLPSKGFVVTAAMAILTAIAAAAAFQQQIQHFVHG